MNQLSRILYIFERDENGKKSYFNGYNFVEDINEARIFDRKNNATSSLNIHTRYKSPQNIQLIEIQLTPTNRKIDLDWREKDDWGGQKHFKCRCSNQKSNHAPPVDYPN